MPEADRAVMTADGHGRAVTSNHWASISCKSAYPGSEIPGVPASDISAISFHSFRREIILSDLYIFEVSNRSWNNVEHKNIYK